MPKYDVMCDQCGHNKEIFLTFAEYDRGRTAGIQAYCLTCEATTVQHVVITMAPGVEWRTDGAYGYDNADQFTRYQRDHYAESGDRSEQKLALRKRRRPGTDYIE